MPSKTETPKVISNIYAMLQRVHGNKTLDQLYETVGQRQSKLHGVIEDIIGEVGEDSVEIADNGAKKIERARDLVTRRHNGHAGYIPDLARITLKIESPKHAVQLIDALKKHLEFIDTDWIASNRGTLMRYLFCEIKDDKGDPYVCEIQLRIKEKLPPAINTEEVIYARREIYEIARKMENGDGSRRFKLPDPEYLESAIKPAVAALQARMRENLPESFLLKDFMEWKDGDVVKLFTALVDQSRKIMDNIIDFQGHEWSELRDTVNKQPGGIGYVYQRLP